MSEKSCWIEGGMTHVAMTSGFTKDELMSSIEPELQAQGSGVTLNYSSGEGSLEIVGSSEGALESTRNIFIKHGATLRT